MLAIEPEVLLVLVLFVFGGGGLVGAAIREFRRSQERKRTQAQYEATLRSVQQRTAGAEGRERDQEPPPPSPPKPQRASPEGTEEPPPK
jgi:hypothetical protein